MYCKRRESTSTGDRLIIANLIIHVCSFITVYTHVNDTADKCKRSADQHAAQTHANIATVVDTPMPEEVADFMAEY